MDKRKIDLLTKLQPRVVPDSYADSVIAALAPPGIWHPIKRYQYYKNFDLRVRVVMAEYARELIRKFDEAQTETGYQQTSTPRARREAATAQETVVTKPAAAE